ncbi:MAG TPA: LamG-like jellyroll fold domain-containing protein, partial [Verrucomicrobiae bacterium]|nr:LamG-like jellyroll fold domain-containing protein [Verrucomicrobiae bacterium]
MFKVRSESRGTSLIGAVFLTLAVAVSARAQDCVTPADGLVSWWQLEGDGTDQTGTAQLGFSGGPTFAAAKVGQGLLLDGFDDFGRAPASADLDIGSGSGLTVETWIKPANAAGLTDIVEWNSGTGGIGVHLSTSTMSARDLYANLVDTAGVSHYLFSPGGLLQNTVFQHVALTYEKAIGVATLYWNGTQVARTNLGTFTPQTQFDFYIGTRRSGPFQGIWFSGTVDELALYRRALSDAEIANIFAAGAAGKCTAPQPLAILEDPKDVHALQGGTATFTVRAQGAPPLHFQWLLNGSALNGANQSSLTLTDLQLRDIGAYAVTVTDATGSLTSAVARLTLTFDLAITESPGNLMVVAGGDATFTVRAQG